MKAKGYKRNPETIEKLYEWIKKIVDSFTLFNVGVQKTGINEIAKNELKESDYYIKLYFEGLKKQINDDLIFSRIIQDYEELKDYLDDKYFSDEIMQKFEQGQLKISDIQDSDIINKWLSMNVRTEILSYLKEKINSIKETEPQETGKKSIHKGLTHKRQVLILYYLGFIDNIPLDSDQKKGKLISRIVDKSEKNTKDQFTYWNINSDHSPIKKNNLQFVYNLFTELELHEIASRIEKDIQELKKIQKK